MTPTEQRRADVLPLSGFRVLEIGGGAAAAYCGRLLVDAGATVLVSGLSETQRRAGIVRADTATERAFAHYLDAGKQQGGLGVDAIAALAAGVDLVLIGEDSGSISDVHGTYGSVALSWFGHKGEFSHWQGSDLLIQVLTGLPQINGPVDGPPTAGAERQASMVAGTTAYIAVCALLLANLRHADQAPATLEISVLESNLALQEIQFHFRETEAIVIPRMGVNRFWPQGPMGIYPCSQGWVGITITTPDQWRALCTALRLDDMLNDTELSTREQRLARLEYVETRMVKALASHDATHWGAVGREMRIPIVEVPDAQGILHHPIFRARASLATLETGTQNFLVPRTPFGLQGTPVSGRLGPAVPLDHEPKRKPCLSRQGQAGQYDDGAEGSPKLWRRSSDCQVGVLHHDAGARFAGKAAANHLSDRALLDGFRVVDFTMGWAGPLATRILGDLGAEILKVEAGRYPDWWRGVNWTAEFIEDRAYEKSPTFTAMNRGKRGVSIDLTRPQGHALALSLIAKADAVIDNQAVGVMAKFKLDWENLRSKFPQLVMASLSAFGADNAWSSTRAYGSTLEHGSGLPSLLGNPQDPPTMTQLALGDPVGGLYGCAALLTALIHRERSGEGQLVNASMIECVLQFATPGLLEYQVTGTHQRRGNRSAAVAPQGIYPAAGNDQWLALSATDDVAFRALMVCIGRTDLAEQAELQSLQGRQRHHDQIDAAIQSWSCKIPATQAARQLQEMGVPAAPVLSTHEIGDHPHLLANDFFLEVTRALSGVQRQARIAIVHNGKRLGATAPAPLLGEHSETVLCAYANISAQQYANLVADGIVAHEPTPSKNVL